VARDMSGGCACGRVRFTVPVADDEAYLCHCRMCQRASGNVSLAMKNVRAADVRWSQEPDWFDSSPIAKRPFCAACGTTLGFAYKEGTDNMDLTVAAFDDAASFKPTSHFGVESMHRGWLNTEGLPEKRTDEHKPLVDRWLAATGQMPG
jgi:hypothetical protein